MEKMVSKWSSDAHSLPKNYIFPPEQRPGDPGSIPVSSALPVIDLAKAASSSSTRGDAVRQILQASQEFGFFQVINHGCEHLLGKTADVMRELFQLPDEDKASLYSDDPGKRCRLLTSGPNYQTEELHFWRDNWQHPCHPLEDHVQSWPVKPANYREIVGSYSAAVREVGLRILDLLCEGLGLEHGYFSRELTQDQILSVNRYPPCPDPDLALGLPKHSDMYLLTLLYQGHVYGLQILKDGQWLGVQPVPDAFVINVGHQLQVISNGKLKSAEHRVITNATEPRTTVVTFFAPGDDCIIQPAASLADETNPQAFRSFAFKDFVANYIANKGDPERSLQPFRTL
uniref:Fe2OG dioxygenase domain-containing protein n=1 Tax=Kalanchoe fedtschenkoi TaxID=63787 RepID=A0A7N1A3B7_KALFE